LFHGVSYLTTSQFFTAEAIAIIKAIKFALELKGSISSAGIVCPPCKEFKTSAITITFYPKFVTSASKTIAKLDYYGSRLI